MSTAGWRAATSFRHPPSACFRRDDGARRKDLASKMVMDVGSTPLKMAQRLLFDAMVTDGVILSGADADWSAVNWYNQRGANTLPISSSSPTSTDIYLHSDMSSWTIDTVSLLKSFADSLLAVTVKSCSQSIPSIPPWPRANTWPWSPMSWKWPTKPRRCECFALEAHLDDFGVVPLHDSGTANRAVGSSVKTALWGKREVLTSEAHATRRKLGGPSFKP